MPGCRGRILNEVGLVGARSVDRRNLGSLLVPAAESEVGAAKQSTEDAHGELSGKSSSV